MRPLEIEAIQYDGTNATEVIDFVGGAEYGRDETDKLVVSQLKLDDPHAMKLDVLPTQVVVRTLRTNSLSVASEGGFDALWEPAQGGP
jgi:hypothetical protein